mmetsp:Transcript_40738/g.107915  ORF Transcript_40738/g.107915 Transcript_40738/m.107915 type:complete len:88 (-) Transcript_40738:198-461(-)
MHAAVRVLVVAVHQGFLTSALSVGSSPSGKHFVTFNACGDLPKRNGGMHRQTKAGQKLKKRAVVKADPVAQLVRDWFKESTAMRRAR